MFLNCCIQKCDIEQFIQFILKHCFNLCFYFTHYFPPLPDDSDDSNQPFEILFPFFLKSSNPKLERGCQIPMWAFECLFKRLTAGSNLLRVAQNQKNNLLKNKVSNDLLHYALCLYVYELILEIICHFCMSATYLYICLQYLIDNSQLAQ